jgi:hypothetical protein
VELWKIEHEKNSDEKHQGNSKGKLETKIQQTSIRPLGISLLHGFPRVCKPSQEEPFS